MLRDQPINGVKAATALRTDRDTVKDYGPGNETHGVTIAFVAADSR
jgi:hypothetical protein